MKYNVLDFAPINKSLVAIKLPSNNLEHFLRRNKTARLSGQIENL